MPFHAATRWQGRDWKPPAHQVQIPCPWKFSGGPVVRTRHVSCWGPGSNSLAGLRSCKLHGTAKTNKQKMTLITVLPHPRATRGRAESSATNTSRSEESVIPCHGTPSPPALVLMHTPSASPPQIRTEVISSEYFKKAVLSTIPLGMGKKVPKQHVGTRRNSGQTHQHPQQDICLPSTWLQLDLQGREAILRGRGPLKGGKASPSSSNTSIIVSITEKKAPAASCTSTGKEAKRNCLPSFN